MLSRSLSVTKVPTCIELIISLCPFTAFPYRFQSVLHHFPTEPIGTANAPSRAVTTGGAAMAAATTEKISTETKVATKITFDTFLHVLRDFSFLSIFLFFCCNFSNIATCCLKTD
ncbi:hypothetical protein PanWU01x14_366360 [Parasponia andersonii]|uniref:Uncharacterized protein n=1 Tax=Parasponia andersonii TaxID=3476 RepID=A0A2P5A5N0_PARAD|nr:hypothetical protein PanWU01x14_366360 [Parasponia andersonii]